MRVAIYLRVSTQKQAEAHTIEQQRERLTSYAIQHGWAVSPENIFRDEGYSGASLKRPGLDHLRDRVAAAELNRILITAPDRLARNYVHQVLLLEELERFGCQVEFLDRPMSQDPHDQLLLQIRGAVAEYERSLIAERMRRGRQRKLAAGLLLPWTRPPYGYRVDPEQPRNPAGVRQEGSEAAVVASIFARYTEGDVSLCGIARQLQQEGAPTPQGKPHWGGSTVRQILRNPVYTGQLYANRVRSTPAQGRCSALRPIRQHSSRAKEQPREEWLALGTVPAIIREDQYVRAQNRMALNQSFSPRSHKAETYLLRALVSCGACRLACTGRTMSGRYEYYWCKGKLSLAQSCLIERCPARYIPAQQLDELVWLDLCQLLENPGMIHQALERAQSGRWLPQEMQAHREQLSRGEKSITNQQERLTEAYLSSVIPLEEYRRRRQDLEQRKSALSQQQRQLEAQAGQQAEVAAMASSIEDFCQRVQAGLAQATFRQKRQLVELLIDRVVVTEEQVEIRYVIPTYSQAEHTRFSQLRTDYRGEISIAEPES